MADERKSLSEYAIQSAVYKIGMSTHQLQLTSAALKILKHQKGLIGPRDADNVLAHLEAAYLISRHQRTDVLKNLFEEKK